MNLLSLSHVPEVYLDKCLKGLIDNIPHYDPECSLIQSFLKTLKFWDEGYQILLVDKMEKAKQGDKPEEKKDPKKPEDIYGQILKNTEFIHKYQPLLTASAEKTKKEEEEKKKFDDKKTQKETKK